MVYFVLLGVWCLFIMNGLGIIMELIDFPVEIIIKILQDLDIVSLGTVYKTCRRLREIVCIYVVKQINLSCNIMATANTLKLKFFKDISYNIFELNMSGVEDLTKTVFLPALPKLKNLKVLDISYTNLNIFDLLAIYKKCSTIKSVTINFTFGDSILVPYETLLQCQSMFEHFENIHFVGSVTNLLFSEIGLCILAKAKLHTLKYSISEMTDLKYSYDQDLFEMSKIPQFNHFALYLLNWFPKKHNPCFYRPVAFYPILDYLEFENYELIIIIIKKLEPKIYASNIFHIFFRENFDVDVQSIQKFELRMYGNAAVLFWKKETTNFDKQFFQELLKHVMQYLPHYFVVHQGLDVKPVPSKYDWFYTMPITHSCENSKSHSRDRQRQGMPNFQLEYDTIFKDKTRAELSLLFKYPSSCAITVPPDREYLGKLTYLSLIGFGRYTSNFFQILFRYCRNLVTLNLQPLPVAPCATAMFRALPLTRTLKNFRLVDKRIDFQILFVAFSECRTLENIYVVDEEYRDYSKEMPSPDIMLAKCNNLYRFYLEASLNESAKTKAAQKFKSAKKSFNKPHLNITIQQLSKSPEYSYDPFIDVFKLNPIKPI